MTPRRRSRPWASVLAATLVGLPLGSIYAFSVFLTPLETLLDAKRSELSLVFGLSTVCYTLGALITPTLFGRLPAPVLILIAGSISGLGMLLASQARHATEMAVGYGGLFGIGSGIAFCTIVQCVNLLVQRNKGLVNGYLISLFPLGAMLAAPLSEWGIQLIGVRETLMATGGALFATSLIGALLAILSGVRLADAAPKGPGSGFKLTQKSSFWKLFLTFFLAAAAGLTMLSQAAGIVRAYGGAPAVAVAATTAITAAIATARITGGFLVDRFPIPYVAACAQLLALSGAVLLAVYPSVTMCIVGINMIGIGYGLISGVMAGSIAAYWEPGAYGRISSRMYGAWCIAAISLPVIAARLFDLTGGYHTAIMLAGACNLLSMVVGSQLPRRPKVGVAAVAA
ncbi:MAG: MFS transporter [Hyphomicrobiaceae bacterium]